MGANSMVPVGAAHSAPALHQVATGLWLGNMEGASNGTRLMELGITHVVNAMAGQPGPAGVLAGDIGIVSERVYNTYATDEKKAGPAADLAIEFDPVSKFVEEAIQEKGAVLIHCQQGTSRSVSFVAAYLMMKCSSTLLDALNAIVEVRRVSNGGGQGEPYTKPNPFLFKELQKLDELIHGQRSMDMRAYEAFTGC